jgi:hypothetical protein
LLIIFSDDGRSEGTSEHTEHASVRTPTVAPELSKDFRVRGDEVEAGIHPLIIRFDGAPGERDRQCAEIALIEQLQYIIPKGLRAPNMICAVPLQRPAQLARLFPRFGQLGLPVGKLSV